MSRQHESKLARTVLESGLASNTIKNERVHILIIAKGNVKTHEKAEGIYRAISVLTDDAPDG